MKDYTENKIKHYLKKIIHILLTQFILSILFYSNKVLIIHDSLIVLIKFSCLKYIPFTWKGKVYFRDYK